MSGGRGQDNSQGGSFTGEHDSGVSAASDGADASTQPLQRRVIVISDSEPLAVILTPEASAGQDAGA